MLKKIILGTLFAGLVAVLVIGAINRTANKSEDSAQAAGRGRGQTQSVQEDRTNHQVNNYQSTGGQGYGRGQSEAENSRQYPNYQEVIDEWVTYDGVVTQVPASGIDLVLEADGEVLVIGTGPLSLDELGFALHLGDTVEVWGYWEDDELKAAEITLLEMGQTVVLRDGWGRPVWSGSGQNGRGSQDELVKNDGSASAAPGNGAQRTGWSGNGGRGRADDQVTPNTGQAEVHDWISLQGAVDNVDESALVIRLSSGELVTVEGRPWWFAQEKGFSAVIGDQITLTGFYESDNFEAGQITNNNTNLAIKIRQENGRPLWAGGGRRG